MTEIKGYTPIFDKDKTATPEEWMTKLAEHNETNPKHGIGCSCMDEFSRELKKMFPIPRYPHDDSNFNEWLNGPGRLKNRMSYAFSMFTRSMDYI